MQKLNFVVGFCFLTSILALLLVMIFNQPRYITSVSGVINEPLDRVEIEKYKNHHLYMVNYEYDPTQNGIYKRVNKKWEKHVDDQPFTFCNSSDKTYLAQTGKEARIQIDESWGAVKTQLQPYISKMGVQDSNLDMNGHVICNHPEPEADDHFSTQKHLNRNTNGMYWVDSVVTCTDSALPGSPTYANGVLTAGSGALGTLGGVSSWNDGTSRVLVKDQAESVHNGIYVVTRNTDPYVLTRVSPLGDDWFIGACVTVSGGTYAGHTYMLSTTLDRPSLILGEDAFVWTLIHSSGGTQYVPTVVYRWYLVWPQDWSGWSENYLPIIGNKRVTSTSSSISTPSISVTSGSLYRFVWCSIVSDSVQFSVNGITLNTVYPNNNSITGQKAREEIFYTETFAAPSSSIQLTITKLGTVISFTRFWLEEFKDASLIT